jgi:monofunctional biosynthetic peptidoglycan transglycosylase
LARAARRRRRGATRRLLLAVVAAVLAVLVVTAALVAPWRWLTPPTTAFIARERLARGSERVAWRWTPLDRISRHLVLCAIAAEDQKFPSHHGFDMEAILKAAREERRRPRGASTISQQVAKNLFLWPGRSFVRKGLEAYLTVFVEQLWPKRRILEMYLNVAEFGPGLFGAEAASARVFGKPASRLSLEEAALLAAVLPNPKRLSASAPSAYVRERAAEIAELARRLGTGHLAGI